MFWKSLCNVAAAATLFCKHFDKWHLKGAPDITQYYFGEITPLVQQQIELNPGLMCAIRYLLTSLIVQKMCSHYLAPCLPFVRQHGAHILYLQEKKKKLNCQKQKRENQNRAMSSSRACSAIFDRLLRFNSIYNCRTFVIKGPNGLKQGNNLQHSGVNMNHWTQMLATPTAQRFD